MSYLTPDRFVIALKKTPVILNALLRGVSQEQAVTATDGPDGWSVVETLCHMVDFEAVSLARVRAVLQQNQAVFPKFDQIETARQRAYPHQNLASELEKYLNSRRELLALLSGLSPEQWQRTGIHSSFGEMSLLEYILHIGWHDVNHIEQITRALGLSDDIV